MPLTNENDTDITQLETKYKKLFFFIFCAIATIAVTFFLLSMQLMSFQAHKLTIEIAKATKQRDLVNTITNTVVSIDNKKNKLIAQKKEALAFVKIDMIHDHMHHKNFLEKITAKLNHFLVYDGVSALVFSGNKIIYSNTEPQNLNKEGILQRIEEKAVAYKLFNIADFEVVIWVTPQYIKDEVTKYLAQTIHTMEYSENQYVWINEVLNYNGGADYAIRKIHPNLKETEGEYLSTSMQDIRGNLPYKMELDGINKDGEIAFEYYFKNLDSNKIEKKMTYAKLYKDYNWIVATGVPITEITHYISSLKDENKSVIFAFYLFNIGCCIFLVYISFQAISQTSNKYRKQISEFVENETQRDMLTGAYNRKMGDKFLSASFSNFMEKNIESAILLIDIDNFKSINDTHGHDVGDIVLIKTVETLELAINHSEKNKLIRWGGEEFIVLLQDISLIDCETITEKMLSIISEIPFLENEYKFSITISIGISLHDKNDISYQDVLKRADIALYHIKKNGKNHYKFHTTCTHEAVNETKKDL